MPRLSIIEPSNVESQTRAQISAWAEHIQELARNGGSPEEITKCASKLLQTATRLLPWPPDSAAA